MISKFDSTQQANEAMQLAIGRIFRLGSRPFQEGDIQQYEQAKSVFLDAAEFIGLELPVDNHPNFSRDYYKIHHN